MGIIIEFSEYYFVVVDMVIKGFGGIYCILFCYWVYYEEGFIGRDSCFYISDFGYYFFVDW